MALQVNGEYIRDERFYREFLQLSGGRTPQQMQQNSEQEWHHLQQVADRKVLRDVLLHQLAIAEGLTATSQEVEEERRSVWGSAANQSCGTGVVGDMAFRLMVKKAERHLTRHVQRPERREVEWIYQNNPAAFALPERWLVSHVMRFAEDDNERQRAMDTLTRSAEELKRGKSFAAVAERYSDCKGNGGSLGWISRGAMVPEFEAHVFALEKRKVSGIFETPFGLHIAIVQDYKPAGVQPLDDVRAELAKRIFEDRRKAMLDQLTNDLFRRAVIEVIPELEHSITGSEKMQ